MTSESMIFQGKSIDTWGPTHMPLVISNHEACVSRNAIQRTRTTLNQALQRASDGAVRQVACRFVKPTLKQYIYHNGHRFFERVFELATNGGKFSCVPVFTYDKKPGELRFESSYPRMELVFNYPASFTDTNLQRALMTTPSVLKLRVSLAEDRSWVVPFPLSGQHELTPLYQQTFQTDMHSDITICNLVAAALARVSHSCYPIVKKRRALPYLHMYALDTLPKYEIEPLYETVKSIAVTINQMLDVPTSIHTRMRDPDWKTLQHCISTQLSQVNEQCDSLVERAKTVSGDEALCLYSEAVSHMKQYTTPTQQMLSQLSAEVEAAASKTEQLSNYLDLRAQEQACAALFT